MPWKPQTRSRHQYEERRLYGGHLLKPGKLSPAAIAREGRGSRAAVCQWAHRLTGHPNRLPALTAESVPGRPARLADKQWQALLKFLSNGALVAGVEPDRWTLPRSRAGVCRHCGAEYIRGRWAANCASWAGVGRSPRRRPANAIPRSSRRGSSATGPRSKKGSPLRGTGRLH